VESQFLGRVDLVLLKFFEQAFVGEVEGMRMLPIMVNDLAEALDDFGTMNFDSEFTAGIEAAGSKIDGADDGAGMVGEKEFAMEFEVLEFMNLNADIVHDAEAADAFDELFFF